MDSGHDLTSLPSLSDFQGVVPDRDGGHGSPWESYTSPVGIFSSILGRLNWYISDGDCFHSDILVFALEEVGSFNYRNQKFASALHKTSLT